MTKQNAKTPDRSSTLDDILSELESRFGSSADKSPTKKPVKKKSFLSSAQSFYAVLGLVLLVVGAGIATFLTQRQQDLRQQAEIAPYTCSAEGGFCQLECSVNQHESSTGTGSCENDPLSNLPRVCCVMNPSPIPCQAEGELCNIYTPCCTEGLTCQYGDNASGICVPTESLTPTPIPSSNACQIVTDGSDCLGHREPDSCTVGNENGVCRVTGDFEGKTICACEPLSSQCKDIGETCTEGQCCGSLECDLLKTGLGYACQPAPNTCTCITSGQSCPGRLVDDQACVGGLSCCGISATNTPTPRPSIIVSPPATSTPTPGQGGGPTNTPVPPTNTPRPTNTSTPRPTNTPTRTPTPTNTPTPLADLELIKRVSNSSPIVGGIITYTIELTNKGPNNATNIVVLDATLFEALGLEFIPGSLSLSHGTVNYTTGEWNIPLLRVNEVATLSADVRVLTVGTKFNQAQVKDVDQEDPDSTPGNIEEPGHQDEDDEDSAVVNPVEPSATATPAPLCLNITMTNPFRGNGEPTQIGDTVTFTCGEVSSAQRYEFRVQLPNGTIVTLNPTASGARISEPFSLSQTGQYKAQCRICNDVAGNFCGEWENL